tara:strand:+ start:338 stop:535 length:198 start_codon:yes stop_codon:yes gene_type:complete
MTLTKHDQEILHMLVQKEIETLQKEKQQLMISNAGFLNKEDSGDLEFLKSEAKYENYLKELLKRI